MRLCNSRPLTASLERVFENEARRYEFTPDPDIPKFLRGANDVTDINACMDELFWAAWPCVSQWLKEQREHAMRKWRSRKLLSVVWNAWVVVADIFPPPLVSDLDSMPGATDGRILAGGIDEESEGLGWIASWPKPNTCSIFVSVI